MEPDSSQGLGASNPSPADSLRDSVACFVRYLELRLELFGLESRETVDCISALPDDADVALGMGLERPGTCRGASGDQYWNGGNLQVQDRKAIFPGVHRRVSKGS